MTPSGRAAQRTGTSQVLRALGYDAVPSRADRAPRRPRPHRPGRLGTATASSRSTAAGPSDNDDALDRRTDPGGCCTRCGSAAREGVRDAVRRWPPGSSRASSAARRRSPRGSCCCSDGGVILLADRHAWGEGRYLAANLDTALERNDRTPGRRARHHRRRCSAWTCCGPAKRPAARPSTPCSRRPRTTRSGVDGELRDGLQRSVEIIANEVLARLDEAGHRTPRDRGRRRSRSPGSSPARPCATSTGSCSCCTPRPAPSSGILPADDDTYEAGYSVARLRELVERDEELVERRQRNGFHLFESLDLLFDKVNSGHRPYGTEEHDDQPGDDEETRSQGQAAQRGPRPAVRAAAQRRCSSRRHPADRPGVTDPRSDDDEHAPRWTCGCATRPCTRCCGCSP